MFKQDKGQGRGDTANQETRSKWAVFVTSSSETLLPFCSINPLHASIFSMIFCSLLIFFSKLTLSKISFRNIIKSI